MNPTERRQLESLISSVCDGALDAQQQAKLDQMLRDSADCRRFYLQAMDMHARLLTHPHLVSGIPLPSSTAAPIDDALLLDRARLSLETLDESVAQARRRRRQIIVGRWLALSLAVLLAVVGWERYTHWGAGSRRPVIAELVGQATMERSGGDGEVRVARLGYRLARGERLSMASEDAQAVLEYADGTQVTVNYGSSVEVPAVVGDVTLRLVAGTIEVDAQPQPVDRPLVFATDHARYVVLGTRFRLYRETQASRLELDEGKVRLERQADGESVEVTAGHLAVAGAATTQLEVRPLPVAKAELLASLPKAGQAVTFSAAGELLATGDWERGLRTWAPHEFEPRSMHQGKIGRSSGLVWQGDTLAQVGGENAADALVLWNLGSPRAKSHSLSREDARSRAIAPDASRVVESVNSGTYVYAIDPARPGKKPALCATLPGKGKAWCLALSNNGATAAAGFWDGTIVVYDLAALERDATPEEAILFQHRLAHTPTRMALSADGRQFAVFSRGDGLLLFDVVRGASQLVWSAGAGAATCIKFTPDGKLLAGLSDGTARMWSVADGAALLVLQAGHVPRDIAWSPQTGLLATASGKVNLWLCDLAPVPSEAP